MATTIRNRQAWTRRCARRGAEDLRRATPRCQSPTAAATTAGRQGGERTAGLPLVAPGRRFRGAARGWRRACAGACDPGGTVASCGRILASGSLLSPPAMPGLRRRSASPRRPPEATRAGRRALRRRPRRRAVVGGADTPRARSCSHPGRDLLKVSRTGAAMDGTKGMGRGRAGAGARATESVDSPIRAGHGAGGGYPPRRPRNRPRRRPESDREAPSFSIRRGIFSNSSASCLSSMPR